MVPQPAARRTLVATSLWSRGVPSGMCSGLGSINPAFEALFLPSNAGTPDVVQWFGLREADSVRPLDQIGH